jgi:hypothetical protein
MIKAIECFPILALRKSLFVGGTMIIEVCPEEEHGLSRMWDLLHILKYEAHYRGIMSGWEVEIEDVFTPCARAA